MIPRILHQTWKSTEIPERWRSYARSWREHHPEWEHRFWTDEALRELIRADYPWFLPIFDGYDQPIKRVDAARYFILHRHGGLYADLDFESLRPIDPLLAGKQLVLGEEPPAHLALHPSIAGHGRLVCNALMASTAGHPFWEHLFDALVTRQRERDPLAATGPFMLTGALASYAGAAPVDVVASELLYPLTSDERRTWAWPERVAHARRAGAFAVHHWSASWFHPSTAQPAQAAVPVRLVAQGERVLDGELRCRPAAPSETNVSCLMVTRGRFELARRAVHCFRAQTHARRELVIVDDDPDDRLARWIAALADPRIVHVALPRSRRSLGALRNLAVERAAGPLICQWDDDDLYHPRRLEVQIAALDCFQADACFLMRERLLWPARRRLACSSRRVWEGSILARQGVMPRYPARRKGEDSPVAAHLVSEGVVVMVDAPELYTYVFHGANTFDEGHFDAHWRLADHRFEERLYAPALRELVAELPAEVAVELLAAEPAPGAAEERARIEAVAEATPDSSAPAPHVLVLTPVKDAAPDLDRYLELLGRLDHPRDRLSVAFLESDSADDTWATLERRLPELRPHVARAEAWQRHFGFRPDGPRWAPAVQRARRSILARSRNTLLSRALRDEDWVLWLDVDVTDYPPDALARLLAVKRSIVVPSCVVAPGGEPFDLNTYQVIPGAGDPERWLVDGLLQPPRGEGRRYLTDLRHLEIVPVDAVGGTMLLVEADLHREGLIFPAAPYRHTLETEGLAALARDLGHRCWGLPGLEIVHPRR